MHQLNTRGKLLKHPLTLGLLAVVLIVGILAVLEKTNVTNFYHKKAKNTPSQTSSNTDANQPAESKIDYTPATSADNTATNQQKESDPKQTTPPPTSTTAQIVLNSVNGGRIRTTVYGTKTGACTATLTNKSDATKQVTASGAVTFQDATNQYICNSDVPTSQLPSGSSWSVVVKLNVDGSSVKSNELTLTIP